MDQELIAAILQDHRDCREDGLCATCACGAGLFTFEAPEDLTVVAG